MSQIVVILAAVAAVDAAIFIVKVGRRSKYTSYGKRSADAESEADAALLYGAGLGYAGYGYGSAPLAYSAPFAAYGAFPYASTYGYAAAPYAHGLSAYNTLSYAAPIAATYSHVFKREAEAEQAYGYRSYGGYGRSYGGYGSYVLGTTVRL